MAGILDNKSRILDVILTPEGRRQLYDGFMRVDYVSFTDKETFYEGSLTEGTEDASKRIFLEATTTPIDQIALETDDTGQLITYMGSTIDRFLELRSDGVIYQGTSKIRLEEVTGSATFASLAPKMIENITQNFKNQRIIGTQGYNTGSFILDSNKFELSVTDKNPLMEYDAKTFSIPDIEPLFSQARLANVQNFNFLPPRWYSPRTDPKLGLCGAYERLQDTTFEDPMDTLNHLTRLSLTSHGISDNGRGQALFEPVMDNLLQTDTEMEFSFYNTETGETEIDKQHIAHTPEYYGSQFPMYNDVINFEKTTDSNNILCQFFEIDATDKKIQKLDVVDGGFIVDPNLGEGAAQFFYIGKIYVDDLGYPSFVNLFTLVLT